MNSCIRFLFFERTVKGFNYHIIFFHLFDMRFLMYCCHQYTNFCNVVMQSCRGEIFAYLMFLQKEVTAINPPASFCNAESSWTSFANTGPTSTKFLKPECSHLTALFVCASCKSACYQVWGHFIYTVCFNAKFKWPGGLSIYVWATM